MLYEMRAGLVAATALLFAGCAAPGAWMGADAEKAYDKSAEAKRVAQAFNNDEYYEVHKEGRIYVISDLKDYQNWLQTNEIPLVVTRIGAGPGGETVKLSLTKSEAKAMEKTVGYKGASQKMYEGELKGVDLGFYGEIVKENRYFVFSEWKDVEAFRSSGEVPCGITNIGADPEGKTVLYVQNCKAAAKGKPEAAIARFKQTYALQ